MLDNNAIVFDAGNSRMRAGFSGADHPLAVFDLVVGHPPPQPGSSHSASLYIGDEVMSKRGFLKLSYPLKDGIVVNLDDMEKVWQHTFYNELRCSPSDRRLMMSHSPCAPDSELEKTAQIMFENFSVQQLSNDGHFP